MKWCDAVGSISLSQLKLSDLVRLHHRVPGVALGIDRDVERFACLDHLTLGNDTSIPDPGDVVWLMLFRCRFFVRGTGEGNVPQIWPRWPVDTGWPGALWVRQP